MGAIAEAFVAYMQPLLDQTDGSPEEVNRALALGQLCYNLAISPEESREVVLNEMRSTLQMDDAEFGAFRDSLITPMIERHKAMFPLLHRRIITLDPQGVPSARARPIMEAQAVTKPVIDRYAPCPCQSGKKYKFCCGMKRR